MSRPVLLQDDFSLGMRSDDPREQLPKGAVFAMTDFLPKNDAPLQKRGGWNRPWNALAAGTYVAGVTFAPFSAGSKIIAFNDSGTLYTMAIGSATVTSVGAAVVPAHPPTFYRNKLYVCDITGAVVPKVYDGSTIAALTTSPPSAILSCAYKDHLVLARSTANTNRVWFSSGGDPTSWNTAASGQWLDTTYPIQGLAAMRNMILVFSEGYTERIRGDIIPGVSGSDMVKEPLFTVGCSDPGSIATTDDFTVFANSAGIYLTDGSGVADLTEQSGNKRLWQSLLSGYAGSWTIAGAVFRGIYHCSVMDGSTFKCAFAVDIKRRVFYRFTNVAGIMMVSTPIGILDAPPAFYMAERGSLFVADLTKMYTGAGSGTYKNDGNGTAVTPSIELPHYMGRPGIKRWKNLYVKHLLTDAATDNPLLTVSFQTDVASSSYTAMGTTLPEVTETTRRRIPMSASTLGGLRADGVSLKVAQTNASADTRINSLEADILTQEQSKQ
jgi:hypothetical protein